MNPTQFAQQIKHQLELVTWPDGSGDVVFGSGGSVLIVAGDIDEKEIPPGFPAAVIRVENGVADEDHPDLWQQTFSVLTLAEVAGGALGEFALIGGARPDLGKSAGAGVLELGARVRAAVENLTGADGARVQLSASTTAAARTIAPGRHVAFDELTLSAVCTSAPYYEAPQRARVAGSAWSWTGAHCSSRFDFVQFTLAYNLGSTPPASPDDAAGVVWSGTEESTTHNPGTSRAYVVFADYAQRGSTASNSSSPVLGSYVLT